MLDRLRWSGGRPQRQEDGRGLLGLRSGEQRAEQEEQRAGLWPLERLRPHVWTVAPRLRQSLHPLVAPPAEPWQGVVEDPKLGPVRLSGRLQRSPGAPAAPAWPVARPDPVHPVPERAASSAAGPADAAAMGEPREATGEELVVLLHGISGSIESHYMVRGARAAKAAGLSCLRLNFRGADCSGEDFYHAGLTADVHAALASPQLRRYRRIYLLGYSMGGHVALRFATEAGDPRVVRVAAVCSPLDLERVQEAIDVPDGWLYRRYVLSSLARLYAAVAARRPMPVPVAEVARLRKIRDFDELVVAPRHGFTGAGDYYARASVAPLLSRLRLPALLVNSTGDPMVLAHTVRPVLARPVPRLEVRWVAAGGHVGFPAGIDLGLDRGEGNGPGGAAKAVAAAAAGSPRLVDDQLLAWLRRD
jgi:predicted alpha/beta-fold hydrolase